MLQEEVNRYYQIWREASRAYEDWARKRGTTYNSVLVLMTLLENGESCTQKMICDYWQLPKQTVNAILKGLETRGYVHLTPSETDKRSKRISLTSAGSAYAEEITGEMRCLDIRAAESLGAEELTRLNDALASYLAYFKEAEASGREG